MKIMDISENDCYIEAVTPRKKKMKQAQLSFQNQSPTESSTVTRNKKRKLTSPSVDVRSPKLVKTSKKKLSEIVKNTKLNSSINGAPNEISECIDLSEDMEAENLKENTTTNKVESENKKKTPRRASTGQKKLKEKDKVKSSPLTKFLKKTDKEVESSRESCQSPLQDKSSSDKSCDTDTHKNASQVENSFENKIGDTPSRASRSVCYSSDSDVSIVSSDNEDKEEQSKPNGDAEKDTQFDSPKISTTPKTDKTKQKKLTPKQHEQKLLSAKKQEERKRLKMEKEKKLEEERENRRKEKEEKRKQKKEKEKAEKEQKLKEKKMKELKKQMEIEQRQKEKQAKEEERKKKEEAKEEEKRKKEEEKLEAERKKQKAASNFTSFFVAKKLEKSIEEETATETKNFMPFEVKADMKIAPVCRRTLSKEEKLSFDEKCNNGNTQLSDLYLNQIKNKKIIPRKSFKTWPLEAKEDVIILDEENDSSSNIINQTVVIDKQRTKLLQFSENQRPPYWGTWRKQSNSINPRRPFTKDMKWFNYEVDSDEEWEEEEPGESLHGSDEEKDEENPDDNEYDVDNEFMVPHGYLSDEEVRADEEDKEDMSPETQKFKLKILGEQFDMERNAKTMKLKPKVIGCIWRGAENTFSENVPPRTAEFLSAHEAWVHQIPVTLPTASENDDIPATECGTPTQQQAPIRAKKARVPKEALPDLIRLVHGNTNGRKFLVKEFMTYWNKKNNFSENQMSNLSLMRKICELGKWMTCPEEGPMYLKSCWYVPEDIRKEYIKEDLQLPNRWSYILVPKRRSDFIETAEKLEKEEKEKEKKTVPLITQFTKKITQEELKKQLKVKSDQTSSPQSSKSAHAKTPKRATLISVARGEQFSKSSKESLLKNFVSSNKSMSNSKENGTKTEDDVIIVDGEDNKEINGEKKPVKKKDGYTLDKDTTADNPIEVDISLSTDDD
ncbi:uncharacterized protein LOC143177244 isoform X2 [Calliopsis andreniformis]